METVHPGNSRPRILIADDHAIFSEALRAYLEKMFDIVGVAADGRVMLQEAIRLRPDVIVADVAMPLLNGLDAARRIREQVPKVRFVFLTMLDDANLAAAALELERVGFILKRSGGRELLKAIEEVLHGRSYVTPKLRPEDWVAAKTRANQFSKELTPRQCDFLQLYAEGKPDKRNSCDPRPERKDSGIPQAPYHGSLRPQEQRRSGAVRLKAGLDLSRARPFTSR